MEKIMNYVKSFVIAAMVLTSGNVWGEWTWTGELPLKDSYHYLYTSYCDKFLQSDATSKLGLTSGKKGLSLKGYDVITSKWMVTDNSLNGSNEYRLYENNGNILVLSTSELNIQYPHTTGVGRLRSAVSGNYCTIRAKDGSGAKQMASKADGTGVERINSDDSKTEWLFVTEKELTAYKNYREAYAKLAAYVIPTETRLYAEVANVLATRANLSNSATIIDTFEELSSVCEAYLAAVATCNAFAGEYASKTCDVTTAAEDLAAARSALSSATNVDKINAALGNLRKFDEISWGAVPAEIVVTKTLSTEGLASTKSGYTISYSASNGSLNLDGTIFTAETSGEVRVIAQTTTKADYYAVRSESSLINIINKLTTEWTANYEDATASMYVGDQITNAFTVKDGGAYTTTITPTGIISFEGNVITALNAGSAIITFEQEANDDYFASTASFEFTVSKIANTLAVAAAEKTLLVEEEWENVMSGKNSDATITTTSTDSELAYYDVESNKIVVPNSGNKASGSTATIHIQQAETYKYEGVDKEIVLTVNKHTPTFTQKINACHINSVIALSDFFESNANTALTFTSQDSKTAVIGDKLYVYDATGDAYVKVSQAENYYWNGKEQTYTLTINGAKTAADWCWETEAPQNGQMYYFYTVNQNKFLNDNNGLDDSLNTQWLFLGNSRAYSFRSQNGNMLCIYDENWKYNVVSNAGGIKKNNANDTIMASDLQNGKYSLYRSANQGIAFGNSNRNVYSTTTGLAIQEDASYEWFFISTTGNQYKAYSNYQMLTSDVSTKTVSVALKNTAVAALSDNDCESSAEYTDKVNALQAVIDAYDAYFELIDYVNASSADQAAKDRIINELLPTKTTAEGILALKDEIMLTPAFIYKGGARLVNDTLKDAFELTNVDLASLTVTYPSNTPTGVTTGSNTPDKIISYDKENNVLVAHNAGTAKIRFAVSATATAYAGEQEFDIVVSKRDVTYEVTVPEVYHNRTLNGYIISSNKECMFSTMTSSNEEVATVSQDAMYLGKLTVTTSLVEGSTTITLAQLENYQWNASGEKTFTITPTTASNHVPFIVNSSKVYSSLVAEQHYSRWNGDGSDWNKEIRVGEDNGFSWDDKYVVLHFEGIPDKMSFNCSLTGTSTGRDYRVFESADGKNFGTQIWSSTDQEPSVSDLQLQPTTRYIKLFYSGNYCAYWHNVSVTELKYFRADVTSLDFGSNQRKAVPAAQSFAFQYCNSGTTVTVTAPAGYEVSLDGANYAATQNLNSDLIGADKMGEATIYVRYLAPEVGTHAGNLTISDNAVHSVTVSLTGTTIKADRTIVWDIADANEITATQSLDMTAIIQTANENPAGDVTYSYTCSTVGVEGAVTIDGSHVTFNKAATVTIYANSVESDQYNDAAPVHKVWTIKKNSVKLEVAEGFIINEKITYGDQGSKITWNDTKLTHVDELDNTKVVEGTIAYSLPAQFNQAGEVNITFNFTPTDLSAYDAKSFTVPVTVQKKASEATATAAAITYGQKVSESALSKEGEDGTWTWNAAIANDVPNAGTHNFAAHFVPTNTNMTELDATVSLTVNKAAAELSWTANPASATYGDGALTYTATSVSDGAISYSIVSGDDIASIDANTGVLTIIKTGNVTIQAVQAEGTNHLAAAAIETQLTINKATPTITTAPTASDVTYTSGVKLEASNLSGGEASVEGEFAWKDDTEALIVGTADHTVVFTPTDNTLYNNIEFSVSVTVLSGKKIYDNGWSDEPTAADDVEIKSNLVIDGPVEVKGLTIDPGVKVTLEVNGSLTVNGTSDDLANYGDLIINAGGQVVLNDAADLQIRNLELNTELGNRDVAAKSSQVDNAEKLQVNGNAYIDITFDPVQITKGYYDFTVPFPVEAANGVFAVVGGNEQKLRQGTDYLLQNFSESLRAANVSSWKNYTGVLNPGEGYTIAINANHPEWNTIRFKKTSTGNIPDKREMTLTVSAAGNEEDKGWNCLGNGSLTHAQLAADGINKLQIYDHTTNTYATFDLNTYNFAVGTTFRVQATTNGSKLYCNKVSDVVELRAPNRSVTENTEYCLQLTENGKMKDQLFLSASDDALNTYEAGRDLRKEGNPTSATISQMWSTAYNNQLSVVELPFNGNQATFPISIFAPVDGEYNLHVAKAINGQRLYLLEDGMLIWDLTMSDYPVSLSRGTTTNYSLMITRPQGVVTDVEEKQADAAVEKIFVGGKLYVMKNGMIFDATGKKVK